MVDPLALANSTARLKATAIWRWPGEFSNFEARRGASGEAGGNKLLEKAGL